MKILLSPTKLQKFDAPKTTTLQATQPLFQQKTVALKALLQQKTAAELASLYRLNLEKATVLYNQYQQEQQPQKQALISYTGLVYNAMGLDLWTKAMYHFAAENTFILSALYGVLKPQDEISPYRLDMTTKLLEKQKLTDYWRSEINNVLAEEALIINLASKEFTALIEHPKMITIDFLDYKDGAYRRINTFCKMARGKMFTAIVKAEATSLEKIKKIAFSGYCYDQNDSTENIYVFKRRNE
ncbi:MAG: YaaA family protein [Culicoidibacterales bacterium]